MAGQLETEVWAVSSMQPVEVSALAAPIASESLWPLIGDHFPRLSPAPPSVIELCHSAGRALLGAQHALGHGLGLSWPLSETEDHPMACSLRELQQRPSLPTQMLLVPVRVASVSWDQALSLFEVALAWW